MTFAPASQTFAQTLYNDFIRTHGQEGHAPLASYARLSEQYHVSHKTISEAIARLHSQKRLVKKSSRCMYLVDPARFSSVQPDWDRSSSWQAYARKIEGMLKKGEFQTRTQLPKISYFTHLHGVSSLTVIQALRHLAQKGLLVKTGKRWLVGPHTPSSVRQLSEIVASYHTGSPEVVVIARDVYRYFFLSSTTIFQPCLDVFYRRLFLSGIRHKVIFTEPVPAQFRFTAGFDQIADYLQDMKERLRGIFILGFDRQSHSEQLYEDLCAFRKPVVLFDPSYRGSKFSSRVLQRNACFAILTINIKNAVQQVVEHLSALGHTRVGIPVPWEPYQKPWLREWMSYRVDLVRRAARNLNPHMQIFTIRKRGLRSLPPENRPAGEETPTGHSLNLMSLQTAAHIPNLRHLVYTKKVTALIALNDDNARHCFIWAVNQGIRVPEELSIVSFDNTRYAETLGLTSIDFRLDTGGYQAAGLLIDGPRKLSEKQRLLSGEPWLITRESSGTCRQSE